MTKRTGAVTEPTEEEVTEALEEYRDGIKADCICQLFKFFDQIHEDSGYPMLDVLASNKANGATIKVIVGIEAEELKPDIEIARA